MQPQLCPPGMSNVFDPECFDAIATYGNAVLASYWGRAIALARNSAGNYTLTLPQKYKRLTRWEFHMQDAAGAVLLPVLKSETVATDGKLVIEIRTEAGVATDPAEGDKLSIHVEASNSFLNDQFVTVV